MKKTTLLLRYGVMATTANHWKVTNAKMFSEIYILTFSSRANTMSLLNFTYLHFKT